MDKEEYSIALQWLCAIFSLVMAWRNHLTGSEIWTLIWLCVSLLPLILGIIMIIIKLKRGNKEERDSEKQINI